MNPLYDFKNQTQHSLYPTQNFVNSLQPYMNATYDFLLILLFSISQHITFDIQVTAGWDRFIPSSECKKTIPANSLKLVNIQGI